uniref:Dehydrin n=1 Tax=Stipa purpurea TaxID=481984 RepID=A0A059SW74_9POAL|nr:dehydrin [Stipa purpurea]
MEDERNTQSYQSGEADQVEVKERGLFDSLLGEKKQEEDKKQEEVLVTGMEKVSVEEPEVKEEEHEGGEKKESLLSKLQRSDSSSSSSSDEEEEVIDENGEIVKRKKKKGLKEKIKEKLPGHKDHVEGEHVAAAPAPFVTHGGHHDTPAPVVTHGGHHDTDVVVEKFEGDVKTEAPPAPEEEKKGFLEKIKEKLPGGHKKPEDAAAVPATHAAPAPAHAPAPVTEEVSSPDGKEKKGILGKIMDKLPGYGHKAAGEEDKAATAAAAEHKTSG